MDPAAGNGGSDAADWNDVKVVPYVAEVLDDPDPVRSSQQPERLAQIFLRRVPRPAPARPKRLEECANEARRRAERGADLRSDQSGVAAVVLVQSRGERERGLLALVLEARTAIPRWGHNASSLAQQVRVSSRFRPVQQRDLCRTPPELRLQGQGLPRATTGRPLPTAPSTRRGSLPGLQRSESRRNSTLRLRRQPADERVEQSGTGRPQPCRGRCPVSWMRRIAAQWSRDRRVSPLL